MPHSSLLRSFHGFLAGLQVDAAEFGGFAGIGMRDADEMDEGVGGRNLRLAEGLMGKDVERATGWLEADRSCVHHHARQRGTRAEVLALAERQVPVRFARDVQRLVRVPVPSQPCSASSSPEANLGGGKGGVRSRDSRSAPS